MVVVATLRVLLLVVASVTPGRGLALAGAGFVVVLLLAVPRPPADDNGLVGDVGGLSFCRLVVVFSLSSLLSQPSESSLFSVSFPLPLSLVVVIVPDFLTSTFALVLSAADVVVVFLVVVEGRVSGQN